MAEQKLKPVGEQKSEGILKDAVAKLKTEKTGKKVEPKVELEREYIIPLRREIMKVPRYTRAKKAVRAIKEFLAKHMRVENRDLRNIKVDKYLNNEVWFRGIRNPPTKIKVKAVKREGVVYVELAEVPEYVKFQMKRDEKNTKVDEKAMKEIAKREEKEEGAHTGVASEIKEESEKEQSTVEAGKAELKHEANEAKHEVKQKKPQDAEIHRQSLKK